MTSQKTSYTKNIKLFLTLYLFHGHFLLLCNAYRGIKNDFLSKFLGNILNTSHCAKGANFVVYGKKEKNEVSS